MTDKAIVTSRFFYSASRSHHAYCMSVDFGMKFEKQNGFWTPEGLLYISGANAYQIRVAQESLHLLDPKVGDLGINALRFHVTFHHLNWYWGTEIMPSDHGPVKIIQRNGTPFHWPEQQA